MKEVKINGRIKGAMMMNNILGYLELGTGLKPIPLMNDFFLNYNFQNPANWEDLRLMVNIFYLAYMETCKETTVRPIEGRVAVTTQYPYFKEHLSSKPKTPDIQINSLKKVDFIDFQNDTHPLIPVLKRSSEYVGFSLTRGEDKEQSSMWLLSGGISELLHGKAFANYVWMDEKDHYRHPIKSNLLYINLKELAKVNSQAGELAGVLIGRLDAPKDEKVKSILQSFKETFNVFKHDTEVRDVMTRAEELIAKGKAKGKAESEARFLPLLDEKEKQIGEKEKQIDEQEKRIAELEAKLANFTTS